MGCRQLPVEHFGTDGCLLVNIPRLGSCDSPIQLPQFSHRRKTKDHLLRKRVRRNYWALETRRVDVNFTKGWMDWELWYEITSFIEGRLAISGHKLK